jgi:hypothetical protein
MSENEQTKYAALGTELVDVLTERGLGAIPKRDLDALLLFLLEKHLGWSSLSNQELSIKMRLPVPKIKGLRYEGALRYTADLDAEFRTRLRRILRLAAFSAEKGSVEFVVEDYASRFVLEEYLKKRGKTATWRFNDEAISAPINTIAALIVDQFDAKERADALARLNVSDPTTLVSEFEAGLLELVDSAKNSKAASLLSAATAAVGIGKKGKVVAALLFS